MYPNYHQLISSDDIKYQMTKQQLKTAFSSFRDLPIDQQQKLLGEIAQEEYLKSLYNMLQRHYR